MPHCFPPAGHFKGPPPYAAGLTFWLELTRIGQEYLWFGPEFMVMILMDLVWVTLNSIWPHFKFLCYWLRPGVHSRWSPGCPATLATLTAPKSFDLLFSTESRTKMVSQKALFRRSSFTGAPCCFWCRVLVFFLDLLWHLYTHTRLMLLCRIFSGTCIHAHT